MDNPLTFRNLPRAEQAALLNWIKENLLPAGRYSPIKSHSLKRVFGYERGIYVTNGQFKGAMLEAGYSPKDEQEQNWHFKCRFLPNRKPR